MEQNETTFGQLPEEILLNILDSLNDVDIFNVMQSDQNLAKVIESSKKCMLQFMLDINLENFKILSHGGHMSKLTYKNVCIRSFKGADKLRKFMKVIENFKSSIEILKVAEFQRIAIKEFIDAFKNFPNLRVLTLEKCKLSEEVQNHLVNPLPCLEEIRFEKCDKNCFNLFKRQKSIKKILVRNTDWTWNGFSHDDFNDLVTTLVNLSFIVFEGSGTGSYFDSDNFPYKIRKLETFLITFNWYVGIRTARLAFLKSQKGFLKELKIHKLPYDFDGGNVLQYIIESMELDTFYYGNIAMILNGQKQEVEEFEATEVQTTSMYEMFNQYPSIKRLKLFLTQTDLDSNAVERIINPPTNIFHNIEHFAVLDHSGNRRLFGLFLGLYKNLQNVKSIKIESHDRNINVILNEFLSRMIKLESIEIDSRAQNAQERFLIIRSNVPTLKSLKVAPELVQLGRELFGGDVEIHEMDVQDY